jgi:predicted RNase H-like HicB family nuclease
MKRTYFGLISRSRKSYGISFPDFPGCIAVEDNPEKLIETAHEALDFHVEGMVRSGEEIPSPSDVMLSNFRDDPDYAEVIAVAAISVDVPRPLKTIAVPLSRSLVKKIDALTTSRMAFIESATRRELARMKKSA